ncbi:unnamed protein product [Polarella glacialis]|uniref:J domain-containing protein n=1 Tax=Polarella glacialis TaxID=89957 RepID=A0A813H621_POLGL|nr:unnamed protein product [Polarella glacialis]
MAKAVLRRGIGQTLYGLLDVCRDADNAQIRSAYRRQALLTHPDKGGTAAEFLEVVEAFEVLSDAGRRTAYDQELWRTGSQDGQEAGTQRPETGTKRARDDAKGRSAESARDADSVGLPSGIATPTAPPREGWGTTEETKRAAALWLEILECPAELRATRVIDLSCRAAEVLLAYARSHACSGGAPVVALNSTPGDGGSTSAFEGPSFSLQEGHVDGEERPRSLLVSVQEQAYGAADAASCGTSLLAPCVGAATHTPSEEADQEEEGVVKQEGVMLGCDPRLKRRRTEGKGNDSGIGGGARSGSRAWICLGRLKICTGASEDVAEAINWHIMLVRMKQLFHERRQTGHTFSEAVRGAVFAALAERTVEGGSSTDPRLRFVTECSTSSETSALFTPPTWDLETALRQHDELEVLLAAGCSHAEVLAAIRRITVASKAAEEEQRALVELFEHHLRTFQKLLRWRGGVRPQGVNAAFSRGAVGAAASRSASGGEGVAGSKRPAFAYAELWHQRSGGFAAAEQLEPLCRGPRRKRADEAAADLLLLRSAQSSGGDAAAKAQAQQLYARNLAENHREMP